MAKKPSAKQVREAVEKLDSEIREINREYFQATYEAQYSDNAAERESEISAAGKNREKKLVIQLGSRSGKEGMQCGEDCQRTT